MKHLDLFSGYGGFTIPASKYGIETINFSEIDKYATAVLEYRFPNIKNLGDITKIKPEDLPDVDIITGGSPCQDLSVAGKGAGLDGGRSGLFFCFINLIKEKQPMYFVWENVKGAFSSSKGWDFARVQIEMEQAGYDVWWQLLNAKDFGVPQNRERIFAIGIRKGSGREILFEQRESKQNINKIVDTGHDGTNIFGTDGIAPTQKALGGGQGAKTGLYAVGSTQAHAAVMEDCSPSLNRAMGEGGGQIPVIVHNLQPRSPNRPSLLKNKNAGGSGHLQREDGVTYTVDTGCTQGVAIRVQGDFPRKVYTSDKVGALASNPTSDNTPRVMEDMRIRRLTPTECERLMGLEDGWTAKGIMDGKIVDISDTQRYKMCGNGVVVNCVDYIYSLISKLK